MQNNKSLAWILILVLALIWGSSFILMKRGLESFSSTQVAALRMGIASVVLIPFLPFYFKQLNFKQNWKWFLAMGMFGNFIPAFLFTKAETGINSSLAGMLNALTPLFTLIVGALLFSAILKGKQIIGVALGLCGSVLLFLAKGGSVTVDEVFYGLLVVLATLCYAISINIIRKHLTGINPIAATATAFALVGSPAIIYLFTTDFLVIMQTVPGATINLFYVGVLAIVGTALSVILFNQLVRITSAITASSVTYLIPIVAIGWGLIDGEVLELFHIIGMAIILAGVYVVNKS